MSDNPNEEKWKKKNLRVFEKLWKGICDISHATGRCKINNSRCNARIKKTVLEP